MSIDPFEIVEQGQGGEADLHAARLTTRVALSVAFLASFMAICEVKSGNIVQGMQQAQADKIDNWSWYQARNIRQEVLETAARQFRALAVGQTGPAHTALLAEAEKHEQLAKSQEQKKAEIEKTAKGNEAEYEALNHRDDQFDLMSACMSIAFTLLAMTALTKRKWLFWVAMVPAVFGVVMGLAALMGWGFHPDALIKPLT